MRLLFFARTLWTLTMLALITACGASPLLNHRTESNPPMPAPIEPREHTPAATGCAYFSASLQTCVNVTWKVSPNTESECILEVRLSEANPVRATEEAAKIASENAPENVTVTSVRLWMPDMGHGGRPPVVQRLDTGGFLISKIYFFMSGRWNVELSVAKANQTGQVIIPVKL